MHLNLKKMRIKLKNDGEIKLKFTIGASTKKNGNKNIKINHHYTKNNQDRSQGCNNSNGTEHKNGTEWIILSF